MSKRTTDSKVQVNTLFVSMSTITLISINRINHELQVIKNYFKILNAKIVIVSHILHTKLIFQKNFPLLNCIEDKRYKLESPTCST